MWALILEGMNNLIQKENNDSVKDSSGRKISFGNAPVFMIRFV